MRPLLIGPQSSQEATDLLRQGADAAGGPCQLSSEVMFLSSLHCAQLSLIIIESILLVGTLTNNQTWCLLLTVISHTTGEPGS